MKLYHATNRANWDNIISKEGLKPICEPELKYVENCDEAIYFTRNIADAEEFSIERGGKNSVILEVDIFDVLEHCGLIELDARHWPKNVVAMPFAVERGKVFREHCNIPPDLIKIVR
jgi:hypothetical protein